jgi:hypothetical protein
MDQPRLFDPGPEDPDPWRNSPENWLDGKDIAWHASESGKLPRQDRTVTNPDQFSGNEFIAYGRPAGMHFGTLQAARERSASNMVGERRWIHPARMSGTPHVRTDHGWRLNAATSDQDAPQTVVDDEYANYSPHADAAVKRGEVVTYENEIEHRGSLSYRALPEATRTWSEDVKADPTAHPALRHFAERDYNPVLDSDKSQSLHREMLDKIRDLGDNGPTQHRLWDAELHDQVSGQMIAAGSEREVQRWADTRNMNQNNKLSQQFKVVPVNKGVTANKDYTEAVRSVRDHYGPLIDKPDVLPPTHNW